MQILFDMGESLTQAISGLDRASRELRGRVSRGMATGAAAIAGRIPADYLSGQSLKTRTGNLRRAVAGWMAGDLDAVIGVRDGAAVDRYKWLLGDNPENQPRVIRPKKGKYLTIPIGEALTASGVLKPKYSVGLRQIDGGFFLRSKGQLLFCIRRGKTSRAKIRPLFVLKTSVEVYDTGALPDGVLDNLDLMTDAIQEEIDDIL